MNFIVILYNLHLNLHVDYYYFNSLTWYNQGFFLIFQFLDIKYFAKRISKISKSSTRKQTNSKKFPSFCPKKNKNKNKNKNKKYIYLQKNKEYKPHGCKLLLQNQS